MSTMVVGKNCGLPTQLQGRKGPDMAPSPLSPEILIRVRPECVAKSLLALLMVSWWGLGERKRLEKQEWTSNTNQKVK